MKTTIEDSTFNTRLEASDWRFSAAIVGLIKYFDYYNIPYKIEHDSILYNSEEIKESRYLSFVEERYKDLHHTIVENLLVQKNLTDDDIKLVNDKLGNKNGASNTIMKKVFNKMKYDGTNEDEILEVLNNNRNLLIKETFGKKQTGYCNFISINMRDEVQLLAPTQKYCRLLGYRCADVGRKSKALGFNFNKNAYSSIDELEFDFIPFAFSGNSELFFINSNQTIEDLIRSNQILADEVELSGDKKDARAALFTLLQNSSSFIDHDVEVIYKERNVIYFETLYIRKSAINIFRKLKEIGFDYSSICVHFKVNDNFYLNIQKSVINSILNNILLDNIIELYLKDGAKRDTYNNNYLISNLIKINVLIRKEDNMNDNFKRAYGCAKAVAKVLPENKLISFRQKLTSSIVFNDIERIKQLLLVLSNYSGVEFWFCYDLLEDFEGNKDLLYAFVNALSKDSKEDVSSKSKKDDNKNDIKVK